jgi:hypothetical protein
MSARRRDPERDAERVRDILSRPTASIPDAAWLFGVNGKNQAYAAARRGDLGPLIEVGGVKRPITSFLRHKLGL